jgi:hypothetical protein
MWQEGERTNVSSSALPLAHSGCDLLISSRIKAYLLQLFGERSVFWWNKDGEKDLGGVTIGI